MALYVVDHRGGPPTASLERSPLVTLETDATSSAVLPETLREVADCISFEKLDAFQAGRMPRDADAVVTWFSGDHLLQGSAATIRQELRRPGRQCFVPVHFPCMTELDLLAIEPRWLSRGQIKNFWSTAARIARTPSPSAQSLSALKAIDQPWAKLVQALVAESAQSGAGIEALARVAKAARTSPQVAALALRNLVVSLMKQEDLTKAEQVLEGAVQAFPDYAELWYVGGLLYFHLRKPSKALSHLERARAGNHEYVGSGGEGSYRAAWLLGKLAAQVGNQRVAFENFYQGATARPIFAPAVDELLNLRLSPALVERYQYDFCRLVRREPQYLDSVFDYLLLHRAFSAARRIAETMPLSEDAKAKLLQRLAATEAPFRPGGSQCYKPGVLLCGPLFEHSSFARINRELAIALMQSPDLDAALEPCCHPALPPQKVSGASLLTEGLLRHPKRLDLTIRHQWPPDFQRPPRGKLAIIVPWEYNAVPRIWVREIEQNVDELWVPSQFVRDVFVRAGVSDHRVHVIPNGIDPKIFTPDGPSSRPKGCRRFLFLFVGGAIQRKGIDLLLEAYAEAFEAGDDVTLLVNTGANRAYSHNSLNSLLAEFQSDLRRPHLAILSEQLDDESLATLYRGCDALVLPYRGEGFGMPVAEAMACGKPVIVTAGGPAPEFCAPDCGYFVPARESAVPEPPPPFGEFTGNWTWLEPDVKVLACVMRHIYEHPEEAAERGREAARAIRRRHTWNQVSSVYLQRIGQLTQSKPTNHGEAVGCIEKGNECRESLCP